MLNKLKDVLGGTAFIGIFILLGACYLNNIIWTFKHWDRLDFLYIALQTVSVFFYPLGVVMGIIHFFN